VKVSEILAMKKSDYYASIGLTPSTVDELKYLKPKIEVVAGVALTDKEYKKYEDTFGIKIYKTPLAVGGSNVFDKIYCNFSELTPLQRQSSFAVAGICLRLCAHLGMVFLQGCEDNKDMQKFIHANHITRYWYIGKQQPCSFNILIQKDDHKHERK
jgi:hypothetical protein